MFCPSFGSEASHEYGIYVIHIHKHDVAVSAAGDDGKSACLVREDGVGWFEENEDIVCFLLENWGRERGLYYASRFGVLVLLVKVAQGSVD